MKFGMLTIGAVLDHKLGGSPRKPKKYWLGGTNCDMCQQPIKKELFDAKTTMGPWGTLCKTHYEELGVGLGVGSGQRYEEQQDGRWLLVEGGGD